MQFTLPLAAGASQSLLLGLGYIENPENAKWAAPGVINKEKAHAMMARYRTGAAFDEALFALWEHWSGLLGGIKNARAHIDDAKGLILSVQSNDSPTYGCDADVKADRVWIHSMSSSNAG